MSDLKPGDRKALLSCPFCGGEAKVMRPGALSFVMCNDCEVTTEPHVGTDAIGSSQEQAIAAWNRRAPLSAAKPEDVHLGLLDDMDHEAKIDTDSEYRKTELRIQALGAALSRRDWNAVEQAYSAIRDKFYSHSLTPAKPEDVQAELIELIDQKRESYWTQNTLDIQATPLTDYLANAILAKFPHIKDKP